MNAITLHSPWAELIAIGAKQVETRSWPAPPTAIGQFIAIHSGKTFHTYAHEWLIDSEDAQAAFHEAKISPYTGLPETATNGFDWTDEEDLRWLEKAESKFLFGHTRGCVLAVATLVGCYQMARAANGLVGYQDRLPGKLVVPHLRERDFGDWTPGRFAWVLTNIVRLPQPVPARGYQQIWQWDAPQSALDLLPAALTATESAA